MWDWVSKDDTKFEGQNQKTLLIVDNCPAHSEMAGLKAIELSFLPPDTNIYNPTDGSPII